MSNAVDKDYPSLIGKRPWPVLRVRLLADGFPSGTVIFRAAPEQILTMIVPPEGNAAWCNAATYIRLEFQDFKWIDDRILFGRVSLTIDCYNAGDLTPFDLVITDHYCNPCGMVNFAKRIQEWQNDWKPDEGIHGFSIVFDHYGD